MIKKFTVFLFLFYVQSSVATHHSDTPQRYDDTIILEQPTDHVTIQNTGGDVVVTISSQLHVGDKWRILFDGKENGTLQTTQQFTLSGIERGEHTLQVQAIDSNNNVLASSAILTIYIHQGVSVSP